jgi:hypothetical protein
MTWRLSWPNSPLRGGRGPQREEYDCRFGWFIDPEGNRVELLAAIGPEAFFGIFPKLVIYL